MVFISLCGFRYFFIKVWIVLWRSYLCVASGIHKSMDSVVVFISLCGFRYFFIKVWIVLWCSYLCVASGISS